MKRRMKSLIVLVLGAVVCMGVLAQPAMAETPEPTPTWYTATTLSTVNCDWYATTWKTGQIGDVWYIGFRSGARTTNVIYAFGTRCFAQRSPISTTNWTDWISGEMVNGGSGNDGTKLKRSPASTRLQGSASTSYMQQNRFRTRNYCYFTLTKNHNPVYYSKYSAQYRAN